jgi:hypothetical protein
VALQRLGRGRAHQIRSRPPTPQLGQVAPQQRPLTRAQRRVRCRAPAFRGLVPKTGFTPGQSSRACRVPVQRSRSAVPSCP